MAAPEPAGAKTKGAAVLAPAKVKVDLAPALGLVAPNEKAGLPIAAGAAGAEGGSVTAVLVTVDVPKPAPKHEAGTAERGLAPNTGLKPGVDNASITGTDSAF